MRKTFIEDIGSERTNRTRASSKYYREFGAEDRFEGDVYTLNLALPLDPIISKLEHVLSP